MARNGTLSRKQQQLIQALALGQSIVAAAEAIGVSKRTAHRWLELPIVQSERTRLEDELRQAEEQEITRIMTTGYAAVHKRIEALSAMADLIKASFIDEDEGEKKIKFAWVTPDKIREFRGCMDDIAKELGQRVKKTELTGKDGGPVEFVTEWGGGVLEDSDESDG